MSEFINKTEPGFKLHLGSLLIIVADNNIGNSGAKYIAESIQKAKWLHTLNLSGNKITDEGLKFIEICIEALKEEKVPNTILLCSLQRQLSL